MEEFARVPLPDRPRPEVQPRQVRWPVGLTPQVWVCCLPAPELYDGWWAPAVAERGARTRGRWIPRVLPCDPRADLPQQYLPQRLLAFPALPPDSPIPCVCVTPEHVVDQVLGHPEYRATWWGAELLLARAHSGPRARVILVGLSYRSPTTLPPAWNHHAALRRVWSRWLQQPDDRLSVRPLEPERDPGQEG